MKNRFGSILLSIVIAFGLWLYVITYVSPNSEETYYNIPVVLHLTVMSFGFKYGLPADANYVADVRFIPNPHWVPALRPRTAEKT